jgi:hypothetical protein
MRAGELKLETDQRAQCCARRTLTCRVCEALLNTKGSDLEDRPHYTHTTTFATFPFPEGMTPDVDVSVARAASTANSIEDAARRLDELRTGWLYPTDLVEKVDEAWPQFPPRLIGKNPAARALLAKRTLTALYNERPDWLIEAHRSLNAAVARAYGWPDDIGIDDAISELLALNRARSS